MCCTISLDATSRTQQIGPSLLTDQISHFLAHHPTLEYRFAFLLTALITVIGPLGLGIVILADSPMTHLQDLRVANMSVSGVSDSSQFLLSQGAKTFVGLELLEGVVYGYDTATEGMLTPYRSQDLNKASMPPRMRAVLWCITTVAIGRMQRSLGLSQPVIFPMFRVCCSMVQTELHGALLVCSLPDQGKFVDFF